MNLNDYIRLWHTSVSYGYEVVLINQQSSKLKQRIFSMRAVYRHTSARRNYSRSTIFMAFIKFNYYNSQAKFEDFTVVEDHYIFI